MKNNRRVSISISLLAFIVSSSAQGADERTALLQDLDLGIVYTTNDNVPRAAYGYQRSDSIVTATIGKSYRKATGKKTQLVYRWEGSIDQYAKYALLSHVRLGLSGAWQYRANGAFGTPTYSLRARAWSDSYRSNLRSGATVQLGGSARKSLTDRITVNGIVETRQRDAASSVFDTRNTSARLNLDYLLSQRSAIYLTYNNVTGDITYSADWAAPYTGYSYDDWANDDAFYAGWRAYRVSGTTEVITLGYNYMFSEKSSVDFSIVTAKSAVYNGPSYTSNVMSVAYLKRL